VTIRREVTCDDGSVRTVYIKREKLTPLRYQLAHLLAGRGLWTKVRAEFEILRQLRGAGFRCPRPIACVHRGWPSSSGVLVLEALAGTRPLNSYLASGDLPGDPASREQFFTALGREIARLHAAGFRQPDLYSNHVHVAGEPGGFRFAFLDLQRTVQGRQVRLRRRVLDLAALWATLPPRLAGQRDVEVFFDAYLADSGWEDQIGQVRAGVDQAIARLLKLRRVWEIRERRHVRAPRRAAARDSSGRHDVDRPALSAAARNRRSGQLRGHDEHLRRQNAPGPPRPRKLAARPGAPGRGRRRRRAARRRLFEEAPRAHGRHAAPRLAGGPGRATRPAGSRPATSPGWRAAASRPCG